MVEECCPACRWKGKSLDHHYRWFPDHKPLVTKPLSPPAPANPLPLPKTKMHLWAADIEDKLGWHVANMHLNKFVSIDNVKLAVTMLEDTVKLLAAAVIEAVRRNATAEVTELFSTTSSAVEGLHNVHKTCEIQCQTYLEQVPRRLLGTVADQRKHFAFFSVTLDSSSTTYSTPALRPRRRHLEPWATTYRAAAQEQQQLKLMQEQLRRSSSC